MVKSYGALFAALILSLVLVACSQPSGAAPSATQAGTSGSDAFPLARNP